MAFAVIFLALNVARFAFIFFVDPQERFLVDPNNVSVNRERWAKPWFIRKYPHNAVLLGTSKLAHVDPVDIDTPELKFFNASFQGALPEEIYSFLDLFVPEARLVIISLDIIPMNEKTWGLRPTDWQSASFTNATIAAWDYLIDPKAFTTSVDYFANGRPERGMVKPNGARNISPEIARSKAMTAPDFAKPLEQIKGAAFGEFKYSEERIGYLEKIKKLLDDRRIQYIILISPENRHLLRMISDSGNAWALERFRTDVRRIFPGAIDYSSSWMSADSNFLKFDPLHYLPSAGAEMIKEAISKSEATRFD
jgi:hypothetical protein